ncbi:assembly of actin patch protein [Rhodotorula toruloides]
MPPTYPYRATALMKYKSAPGGPAFSFGTGDELRVLAAADDEGDWLEGENGKGDKGVFPSSFVRRLDEEEGERGDSASSEAAGTALGDEAGQEARETVEATPRDHPDVVEASESTPADEPALAAQSSPPPASSKEDAPPTETITSPTLADVTPSSSTTRTDAPAKSASPPPAKKPNALASRIAAFNAAAQQQTPPPVAPKPKPRQWARPAAPAASPPPPAAAPSSDAPPALAPAAAPSNSTPPAPSTDETQTQAQRDFSAEDAQESISRGGGSLRDRIKALQGGLKMEQPPAPGRGPPKPRRKPSAEPEAGNGEAKDAEEGKKQDEAEILQDAVVKDERPREDETTAQSPGAEVPGFDPAESDSPFVPGSVAGDDEQDAGPKDEVKPVSSDAVKQESAAASIAAPATIDATEQDPTVSSVAAPVLPEEVEPVQDESAAPADEDDEDSRRANLAARMANLGGQRMGLPMPALPKRAAGPRARKAKAAGVSPAAIEVEEKALGEKDKAAEESATTDLPVAPAGTDDAEASVVEPPQDGQKEQKGDVLSSMGGASALLAQDDNEEDSSARGPVDDGDFDSSAPPAPPRRFIPPPAGKPEPAVVDDESSDFTPPPPPSSRPHLPPSLTREDDESTDDLPESGAAPRSPHPPARPLDPPAFSSGAETIETESRPTARESEHDSAGDAPRLLPPIPRGRPPVPPAFQRQVTEQPAAPEQDEEQEEEASKDEEGPQHPPIPTHPAPLGEERVTTAAEDAVIAQMPEIVTPPEEAADESTAAPSLNAPTTETIAQGRIEDGHEPADMGQPAWGKVEGTETPAVELSPPALAPKMVAKEDTKEVPIDQTEVAAEEDDEEEEEEDPEIARRRALAARMAKLGGRGPLMGGPMLGFGGLPPKKPAKKKPTSELAEQGDLNAAGGPKPDEPPHRDEEEAAPAPPPRRPGGIPAGGFALPGIAPLRLPRQTEPEQQPAVTEEESEPLPTSSKTLAEKSAAATDEAFDKTDEERATMQEEGVAQQNTDVQEAQDVEEDEVPPPLPPSRPSTLPPRRSVPNPAEREQQEDAAAGEEPEQADFLGHSRQVEEPEAYAEEPHAQEDEDELPPPPPPPRPAGGHQSSLPLSPPMPPTRATPSSPPTHPASSPILFQQEDAELARTTTQSSRKSSIHPPRSPLPFEPMRADSTSSSQAQHPTFAKPNLDALLQWSASLGAQVFAAAHTKMSDKQARGLSDVDLVNFCFSRATEPLPPTGGKYGVKIYEATVEQGKKAPVVSEHDEPRAGDAKFKHNLSSKTVGSVEAPHVAIVAGWDAKKGKLKVVEVEGKNGTVDEGSYRIDEMRAGHLVVYRVPPKDFLS